MFCQNIGVVEILCSLDRVKYADHHHHSATKTDLMDLQIPIIDLSLLRRDPLAKSSLLDQIRDACRRFGFFNVINHSVGDWVMEEALDANRRFFEMGMKEKEELISDDVLRAVRFGKVETGDFRRDFLKLYAYPLQQFISSWPRFPSDYRGKMGVYATEVRKLSIELFGAILESLNIQNTRLEHSFDKGFHILGINSYAPSLESNVLKTGTPPHTDHSIITVLLQSAPGLEFIDDKLMWKRVPELKGSLLVLVGNHLEVISNGLFKSVLHRAIPECDGTRLSIGSFHSFEMDELVEPATKLVGEDNSIKYKKSSLRDFLQHLASKDKRTFIETIKN